MYVLTGRGRKSRTNPLPEAAMNVAGTRGRCAHSVVALACAWLLALAAGGCHVRPIEIPGRDRDPRALPGSTDDRATRAEDAQVSMKRVMSKQAPTTLIADDGSRCTVSEKRYNDTRIGDDALCVWRSS